MRDFLKGFKQGFKNFGYLITIIVNSILLLIVYCLGVGLTSLVAKIVGKNFLQLNLLKRKNTYWENLNLTKKKREEYLRQF